ncbi:hypothetical protein BGZ63DRAFT_386663 [Mariannaea sp. PMI_226]|nr:hypothetical protein BGZ63DRAFT_386663 [Mariannaea sp. PMI_226]
MKFNALLLLLPLVSAIPATESAEALQSLAEAGEQSHNLPTNHPDGKAFAAALVCPAKYPRYCSLGGFCCRTKKCCKKECCQNSAKYCISGRCYK